MRILHSCLQSGVALQQLQRARMCIACYTKDTKSKNSGVATVVAVDGIW